MTPALEQPAERGSTVVPWLLLLMALGAFTPCVLLPEWRTYQAVHQAEQAERHRLESLRRVVDHERRLLQALTNNTAVIARVAQRELRFQEHGTQSVLVSVPPVRRPREEPFVPAPVLPPPILARVATYLPDYNYDRVFCADETRPIIMAMSAALTVVALCMPRRRAGGARQQG